ncbi:lysosomal proton-coupled steroid conjugate and bile acid symporter SLC46A3-like [Anticarsia gemmatalis]|uniref:lysosomal proton-coupled steroid conjugate and bile acid symporter SLC46A3-like n=1 Tax=Anticarsia gemmatalis TaxID=129554 RepID=UPI003F75FFD8
MSSKSDKNVELTDTNGHKHIEANGTNENRVEETPVSWKQRIRMFFNFFTVEPFLLCYILPIAISGLAVQKLNFEKACRTDLGMSEEICLKAVNGEVDDNDTLGVAAQLNATMLVADMTAWQNPLQSSIPAIVILNVGAWSDKTGNRKALMLIPVIGEIISSAGLLLATYFFLEWPLWSTALIEALPSALTGGYAIALMGSYSLIADMTSIESRTFRIGMVGIIVTLGVPFGTSISGVLTEAVGYYGIFGINLGLYIIGFIYTLLRIKNVRTTKLEGTLGQNVLEFFHPKNVWDTVSLLFLSPKKQLIQIILVICAHIIIMGPVFGEAAVLFLYVLTKFSMNVVDFSLFSTYSILMGTAGSAVAVTLFSKKLKWHDSFIGIIATACKTLSGYAYALAPTRDWLYAAPVFDFFGNSGAIAIRSLGTKVVDQDKVGKICSLIGFVETLIPVIYIPLYSKLFSNTVETLPGAVYFLGGTMTIPAFLIFIALYTIHKRRQRDIVTDPTKKEMHAFDNDVTSL